MSGLERRERRGARVRSAVSSVMAPQTVKVGLEAGGRGRRERREMVQR